MSRRYAHPTQQIDHNSQLAIRPANTTSTSDSRPAGPANRPGPDPLMTTSSPVHAAPAARATPDRQVVTTGHSAVLRPLRPAPSARSGALVRRAAATSPRLSVRPPSGVSWRARSMDRWRHDAPQQIYAGHRIDTRRSCPSPLLDLNGRPRVRDADSAARSRSIAADWGGHVGVLGGDSTGPLAGGGEWLLRYFSAVRSLSRAVLPTTQAVPGLLPHADRHSTTAQLVLPRRRGKRLTAARLKHKK